METHNIVFYRNDERVDLTTIIDALTEYLEEMPVDIINKWFKQGNFAFHVEDIVVENGKVIRIDK